MNLRKVLRCCTIPHLRAVVLLALLAAMILSTGIDAGKKSINMRLASSSTVLATSPAVAVVQFPGDPPLGMTFKIQPGQGVFSFSYDCSLKASWDDSDVNVDDHFPIDVSWDYPDTSSEEIFATIHWQQGLYLEQRHVVAGRGGHVRVVSEPEVKAPVRRHGDRPTKLPVVPVGPPSQSEKDRKQEGYGEYRPPPHATAG